MKMNSHNHLYLVLNLMKSTQKI